MSSARINRNPLSKRLFSTITKKKKKKNAREREQSRQNYTDIKAMKWMSEIAEKDMFPCGSYEDTPWPTENWFQLYCPGVEHQFLPNEDDVTRRFKELRFLFHPDKNRNLPEEVVNTRWHALQDSKENLIKQIRSSEAREEYIAQQTEKYGPYAELTTSKRLEDTTPDCLVYRDMKLPRNVEVYVRLDGNLHFVQLKDYDTEKDAFKVETVSPSALKEPSSNSILLDGLPVKPSALYTKFFTFEYVFCENRLSGEKVGTRFRLMFNTQSNITVISFEVAKNAGLLQEVLIEGRGGKPQSCGHMPYQEFIHGSQLMSRHLPFKCSTENIEYSDNSEFEPRVEVALIIRGVRLVCSVVINMKSNADQEDADVYLGRTDWKKFRELSSLEFEETPPVPYSKELSA